ncbi:MAG TPA: family 16 glycosylhydrolase [Trebonia sp.]|nr:family 16 glycosylhydrolase [Trebonia sp.]
MLAITGLVLLATTGAGAFIAYDGNTTNTAGDATTTITRLGVAAVGRGLSSPDSPAVIAQAIANGPAPKAGGKQAKPRQTTKPAVVGPNAPAGGSGGGPDPSGQNPPSTLSGFTATYVQEFSGDSVPPGWDAYHGVPGGESSQVAQWVPSMCSFGDGEAHFMALGIDSCGLQFYGASQEYGAWFARLKGDDEPSGMSFSDIFLLWPANNQWPPEIDIYEDTGENRSTTNASMYNTVGSTCGSSPTAQCLAPYEQSTGQSGGIPNNGSAWHTYGVEWTPSGVTWLIDGRVVYTAPASQVKSPARQPAMPMNMDLQSQNLQGAGAPSTRETMTVDWVEQFSWNG